MEVRRNAREATPNVQYAALDLKSLREDLPLLFDLYTKEGEKYVLFRRAPQTFTMADRERLLAAGLEAVWVRIGGGGVGMENLASVLSLPDALVPPLAKAGLLYDSAHAISEHATNNTVSRDLFQEAQELLGAAVSYLACRPKAFPGLVTVMSHDVSVYTHAVNVAVYALALGRFIGISDHRDIQTLGVGAILHDVGKARVPKDVLSKPGPLSLDEWALMRQHPLWGIDLLLGGPDIPSAALAVIAQHHERLDGSGYPYGIEGESVTLYSKIVALVDAYDAMTGGRPYRRALSPHSALQQLKRELGQKFDPDLYRSFDLLIRGIPFTGPSA